MHPCEAAPGQRELQHHSHFFLRCLIALAIDQRGFGVMTSRRDRRFSGSGGCGSVMGSIFNLSSVRPPSPSLSPLLSSHPILRLGGVNAGGVKASMASSSSKP